MLGGDKWSRSALDDMFLLPLFRTARTFINNSGLSLLNDDAFAYHPWSESTSLFDFPD